MIFEVIKRRKKRKGEKKRKMTELATSASDNTCFGYYRGRAIISTALTKENYKKVTKYGGFFLLMFAVGASTVYGNTFLCVFSSKLNEIGTSDFNTGFDIQVRGLCMLNSTFVGAIYISVLAAIWYLFWSLIFGLVTLCRVGGCCKKKYKVYKLDDDGELKEIEVEGIKKDEILNNIKNELIRTEDVST